MKSLKKSIYTCATAVSILALTGCVFPNTTAVAVVDDPISKQLQIIGRVSARGGAVNYEAHHAYYHAIDNEIALQNQRGIHTINPYKASYYQEHFKEIKMQENSCLTTLHDLKRSQLYAMRSSYLAKYVMRPADLTASLQRARDMAQTSSTRNTPNYQNCVSVLMYASAPEVVDRTLKLAAEGRVPVLKHYTQRVWHKTAVEAVADTAPLTLEYLDAEIDDLSGFKQRMTILFDPFAYDGMVDRR
jgi:hypothetical protein